MLSASFPRRQREAGAGQGYLVAMVTNVTSPPGLGPQPWDRHPPQPWPSAGHRTLCMQAQGLALWSYLYNIGEQLTEDFVFQVKR